MHEVIIEMEHAFIFVTGISDGSSLAVVASGDADVGLVAYEMKVLVDQASKVLTPELPRSFKPRSHAEVDHRMDP